MHRLEFETRARRGFAVFICVAAVAAGIKAYLAGIGGMAVAIVVVTVVFALVLAYGIGLLLTRRFMKFDGTSTR